MVFTKFRCDNANTDAVAEADLQLSQHAFNGKALNTSTPQTPLDLPPYPHRCLQ